MHVLGAFVVIFNHQNKILCYFLQLLKRNIKYAVPIFKCYSCVSLQYHITMNHSFFNNMVQLQSKLIVIVSLSSCGLQFRILRLTAAATFDVVTFKLIQNAQLPRLV